MSAKVYVIQTYSRKRDGSSGNYLGLWSLVAFANRQTAQEVVVQCIIDHPAQCFFVEALDLRGYTP